MTESNQTSGHLVSGLKELAQKRGIQIGTCVAVDALTNDRQYAQTLIGEFNLITPENTLKFEALCPEKGVYNFAAADTLMDFAEANGMVVRGHVLVWGQQLPWWLNEGDFTRDELIEIMVDHIQTVVGRYASRILFWDVVNEAIDYNGEIKECIWSKIIGPDYIEIAFKAARAADPKALLFYNDFGAEACEKQKVGIFELVRDLIKKQIPIDGIGLQMHLHLEHFLDMRDESLNLQRLKTLKLQIHITELDVRMPVNGNPNQDQLLKQAFIYAEIIRLYLSVTNDKTIILWGFTDRYDWVPHFFPNEGLAMIFDNEYHEKPAYYAIADQLSE